MRQEKREIKDKKTVEELLCGCRTMQLGLWDGKEPYVVTVNFGYADGAIYFHSAQEGRKMDCIKQNGLVSFVSVIESNVVTAEKACGYTTHYTSVTGFGHAQILESIEEKTAGLDIIMGQHDGPCGAFDAAVLNRTAVIKVKLERLVGKNNPASSHTSKA
ncbi:pyridoxamine 5'-phosphate oxidase family protein [Pseudodesulfovibrio piezophilus]|uniref:Pyridoxamine 5'-phosphate oxidase-related FMN-binding n=1 Tax=Pseudodesulfovibrio piezophilus (strain DSM 21447 / JCM 15486 / C1TLV30) TaxID=1322246 RepID=M1WY34_PSEP2|nr:pyridoxamine 5'-phosphate oxidase family protein [Pseudodesulfovibrio piezophilus]CCH50093.1 conserved protein of unknown function [Pseudodesulfovibrio piezophilus C1TLV30]